MLPLKQYIKEPRLLAISVLKKLNFLFPDKQYLELLYWLKMGKKLNLKNPQTFTEKLQWLKLYNRKPEYTKMVDKIAAKEYVAYIIGKQYIIPTLGVWNHFDEIDFDKLPNQFVLKTNNGGGGGGIVICHDKSTFDKVAAKKRLEHSLKVSIYSNLREWPYKNISPKIFAEQYIKDDGSDTKDLIDYKFYCFNGEPKFCQVIQDRHTEETIDFFDMEWKHQEFVGLNPVAKPAAVSPLRPMHYDLMQRIAAKLSKGIPYVRVDLYEVGEKVYFGEITFFSASGFGLFSPEEFDKILGMMISLPKN